MCEPRQRSVNYWGGGGTVGANGGRVITFYASKTSRVTINLCSALGVMVLSSKDKTTVTTVMRITDHLR